MDFDMLGLSPRLVAGLAAQNITDPTPIQTRAIPHGLNGRDVLGIAQTGTGKTAAFGLPLLDALMKAGTKPAPRTCRGLILAPTRELVSQICESLRAFTEGSHLKLQVIVGGVAIGPQIKRAERGADLIVATPGRLIDLLDRKALRLSETRFLVLDEADQMLDLGFIHALRKIAPLLPAERQTMLFSATMPKQMEELSRAYLTDPARVEVAPPGKIADKITQSVHFVEQGAKTQLLIDLLGNHRDELALVFSRTKHGADRLARKLSNAGFETAAIHGNRSQGQRERALKAFREGTLKVLVATDVAARGIDIPDVRFVYNFDLPNVPENFVHRIGRTARAGRDGQAVAFCAPEEMGELRAVQKVMGLTLPVAGGTPWEVMDEPSKPRRGGGGRGRGPGGGGGQRRGSGGGKPTGQGKPQPKPQGKPANKRRRPRRARAAA
ncbi:DEAD/DEAH box helicase [Dinoroseobacter shibae]|nr:DEAD/DEAH box helicase [Dinoroseobacter shibae]URF45875.1 DEAD/DEAH box helicase [Dinoroseobacter shibae]URF50182.1 DEAD/DEAH box helicase [Dinoroseobacter shibae]